MFRDRLSLGICLPFMYMVKLVRSYWRRLNGFEFLEPRKSVFFTMVFIRRFERAPNTALLLDIAWGFRRT